MIHKLVAQKYYQNKMGGVFMPPPKFLKNVQDFIVGKYASHLLAKTEKRIEELQRSDSSNDLERMLDQVKRAYPELLDDVRDRGLRQPKLYPLRPDQGLYIQAYRDEVEMQRTNWRGETSVDISPVVVYQYMQDGRKKGKSYTVKTYQMSDKFLKVFNKHYQELYTDMRRQEKVTESPDVGLVELHLLRRELLKYTNESKLYKATATTQIPVELDGWDIIDKDIKSAKNKIAKRIEALKTQLLTLEDDIESLEIGGSWEVDMISLVADGLKLSPDEPYIVTRVHQDTYSLDYASGKSEGIQSGRGELITYLRQVVDDAVEDCEESLNKLSYDDLHQFLNTKKADSIKVVLDFIGHTSRGGVWFAHKRELQVDVPFEPVRVDEWKDTLFTLEIIARHECQHVGQFLIDYLKGLDERGGGLPSRSIRDLKYTPQGFIPRSRSNTRKDHALQDVEFYTRLKDEISKCRVILNKVPPKYHPSIKKIWISSHKLKDLDVVRGLNLGPDLKPAHFFEALKAHEPDKYKKAVKEFISSLA
jgi:hypothetical protein